MVSVSESQFGVPGSSPRLGDEEKIHKNPKTAGGQRSEQPGPSEKKDERL